MKSMKGNVNSSTNDVVNPNVANSSSLDSSRLPTEKVCSHQSLNVTDRDQHSENPQESKLTLSTHGNKKKKEGKKSHAWIDERLKVKNKVKKRETIHILKQMHRVFTDERLIMKHYKTVQPYSVKYKNEYDSKETNSNSCPDNIIDYPINFSRQEIREFKSSITKYTAEEKERKNRVFGSTRSFMKREKFTNEYDHKKLLLKLEPSHQDIYINNPHLRQVFVESYTFHQRKNECPFSFDDRILAPNKRREKYRGRRFEIRSTEHWGQRKLIMSEIEFLTANAVPGDYVLYVGAAPGSHINFLAEALFPFLKFILIDPAPFDAYEVKDDKDVPDKGSVQIINDYFTDDMAVEYYDFFKEKKNLQTNNPEESWQGPRVLFMSDIRTIEYCEKGLSRAEQDKLVIDEMRMQERWVPMLQADVSMLKFRLPYDTKNHPVFNYLKGTLLYPMWAPNTTSESRLVVYRQDVNSKETDQDKSIPTNSSSTDSVQFIDHFPKIDYDVKDYEDAMFYFNCHARVTHYPNSLADDSEYDNCYDCSAEIFVLQNYLKAYYRRDGDPKPLQNNQLMALVENMSLFLTKSIGKTRDCLKLKDPVILTTWPNGNRKRKRGLLDIEETSLDDAANTGSTSVSTNMSNIHTDNIDNKEKKNGDETGRMEQIQHVRKRPRLKPRKK